MTDFYTTLGVPKNAEPREIKDAFRKLSLKYHPDRNRQESKSIQDKNTTLFQEINDAYETLSDTTKKQQYDMEQSPQHSIFNQSHNDIFSHFFQTNGMGPNVQIFHNGKAFFTKQKPQPIDIRIPITLENAFNGANIKIEFDKRVNRNNSKFIEKEKIDIHIPKGIQTGETIYLKEKGHIDETMIGDIRVHIQIINHPIFEVSNNNLIYKSKISLKEALCGFSIDIPHISGKILRISNQQNFNVVFPGYEREIESYGMERKGVIGKLVVVFEIIFPTKLDELQRISLDNILL